MCIAQYMLHALKTQLLVGVLYVGSRLATLIKDDCVHRRCVHLII